MYHDFTYQATLGTSLKAAWALDDVLHADDRGGGRDEATALALHQFHEVDHPSSHPHTPQAGERSRGSWVSCSDGQEEEPVPVRCRGTA